MDGLKAWCQMSKISVELRLAVLDFCESWHSGHSPVKDFVPTSRLLMLLHEDEVDSIRRWIYRMVYYRLEGLSIDDVKDEYEKFLELIV